MTKPITYRRPPLSLKWLTVTILALCCVGAAAAGARNLLSSDTRLDAAGRAAPPLQAYTPVEAEGSRALEAEIITLRRTGFEPAEITRPRGRFLLGVNNRSGREVGGLRLEREDGSAQPQSRRWLASRRDELDLPPGRYFLSVDGSPDWACVITITPR